MEEKTVVEKLDDCIERLTLDGQEVIAQKLREIREEISLTVHKMQDVVDTLKEARKKDMQIAFYNRQKEGYIVPSENVEDLDRGFTGGQRGI